MKGSIVVAVATGTLMVVAYGGFAMAVEAESPDVPLVAITATSTPDEASGEETSGDASPDASEVNGLVCVLMPIESEPVGGESVEGQATDDEPVTVEQLLEVNTIECSGTGNERSSEVALVPRYLAHSDEFTGAEKGAAISAWAKTHANKKAGDDEGGPVDDGEEASGDVSAPSTDKPASPGRSGDAPGHSGSRPGNGGGH